jgi:deoxyadenosine/deoxycytidine kinase
MDVLHEQFAKFNIYDSLDLDIEVIIECYLKQYDTLDTTRLCIRPDSFESEQCLYNTMLNRISNRNLNSELLELMPYIDDYLEYYANL